MTLCWSSHFNPSSFTSAKTLLPDETHCAPCAATAEALFSTGEDSRPDPTQYTPSFQHQYWANLAGNLTHVHLAISEHFGQETCAALNQLTRLQRLSLEAKSAFEEEEGPDEVEAQIDLHLPQLLYFSVADFVQDNDSPRLPKPCVPGPK